MRTAFLILLCLLSLPARAAMGPMPLFFPGSGPAVASGPVYIGGTNVLGTNVFGAVDEPAAPRTNSTISWSHTIEYNMSNAVAYVILATHNFAAITTAPPDISVSIDGTTSGVTFMAKTNALSAVHSEVFIYAKAMGNLLSNAYAFSVTISTNEIQVLSGVSYIRHNVNQTNVADNFDFASTLMGAETTLTNTVETLDADGIMAGYYNLITDTNQLQLNYQYPLFAVDVSGIGAAGQVTNSSIITDIVLGNGAASTNLTAAIAFRTPFAGNGVTIIPEITWWKFDEGSGTTVADSVGGNTGTLFGSPSWSEGGVSFDGTDDYMSFPSGHNLPTGSSARSLTAWLKVPDYANYFVLMEYGSESTSYARVGWYIGNGAPYAGVAGGGLFEITGANRTTDAAVIPTGTWTFLALTTGSDLDSSKFYKNGVLVASTVNGGNQTLATTQGPEHYINALTGASAIYNAGILKDYRIFNRALTAIELQWLYNRGPSQ